MTQYVNVLSLLPPPVGTDPIVTAVSLLFLCVVVGLLVYYLVRRERLRRLKEAR